MRQFINLANIPYNILMHIHHEQNKYFIDVAEEVKDEFPSLMIFEKQMETKNYIF